VTSRGLRDSGRDGLGVEEDGGFGVKSCGRAAVLGARDEVGSLPPTAVPLLLVRISFPLGTSVVRGAEGDRYSEDDGCTCEIVDLELGEALGRTSCAERVLTGVE